MDGEGTEPYRIGGADGGRRRLDALRDRKGPAREKSSLLRRALCVRRVFGEEQGKLRVTPAGNHAAPRAFCNVFSQVVIVGALPDI